MAASASASLLPSAAASPLPAASRSRRPVLVSASLSPAPIRAEESERGPALSRREGLAAAAAGLAALAPRVPRAAAVILEADEDDALMEKVKEDRRRRIQRQGVINSSDKETGYLQDAIYNLSKVGQAIEKNNLSAASSVIPSIAADWIQNINIAFTKLTYSPEGQTEVDTFNSSMVTLVSSVGSNDIESSKVAFVSSAAALEKWVGLSGLTGQLKGL